MRVSMTKLRKNGFPLPEGERNPMLGDIFSTQYKGGDTWFKVLEFQPAGSYPGQHELFETRVKNVPKGGSIVVFSGSAQEDGAWVCQEWEIDFHPVGQSWVKSEPRYPTTARVR